MKRTMIQKTGDFLLGKGFYIVLFLCVSTIGVSGYYLFQSVTPNTTSNLVEPVTANPKVTIPDPKPVAPKPKPEPKPVEPKKVEQAKVPVAPTVQPTTPPKKEAPAVYTWPVKGDIIRPFDGEALSFDETMGDWRTHTALDIRAAVGTNVLATSAGTIHSVLTDDMMGTTVVIDHGNGVISVLSNLSDKVTISTGDTVATGTVIGVVGETALAESTLDPHLHLELTKDGKPIDPTSLLPKITQ